ncbi:MAG: hypothetical protein ACI9KE_003558 [Polyangiales bacterium]|jgi:hypothetical protein
MCRLDAIDGVNEGSSMAIGSIVLGMGAFLCMIVGIIAAPVPVVGALFSFGGPVLALAGIVTGGVAMSRSKQETGDSSGAAIAGLVVSIVAFFLSLIVALTCGLCNACLTSSTMDANQQGQNGGNAAGSLFGQAMGEALEQAGERVGLSVRLSSIQSECRSDPSGATSARHFHPATFSAIQGSLCAQMGPLAAQAFSRDCSQQTPCSTRIPMAGTPEGAQAQSVGITDLTTCSVYTTAGSARLGMCSQNGEAFLVSVTNLNDVQ